MYNYYGKGEWFKWPNERQVSMPSLWPFGNKVCSFVIEIVDKNPEI